MKSLSVILASFVCIIVFMGYSACAENGGKDTTEFKKEVRDSMKKGIDYLFTKQNADGSIGVELTNPAVTGLAVTAIAKGPLRDEYMKTPEFEKAVKYILSCVKEDGAIYGESDWNANYNTSICLSALASLENQKYADQVKKTQKWVKDLQAGAGMELEGDDRDYLGGFGYRKGFRGADMSNTVISLVSLRDSGLSADDETWTRAVKFVEKCQNTKTDGGFIYRPNESKAGVDEKGNYRSYQSMTYAGLLSMVYANVDKDDERVKAAFKWINKNWDLSANTPLDKQGLFYNYQMLGKALAAYGEKTIVDQKGEKHDWYRELGETLIKLQDKEGFWVNGEERWYETDPVLVTCYSLLALADGYATYK